MQHERVAAQPGGLDTVAEIIDPGTPMFGLAYELTSGEFREAFHEVDLVLVRGEVNWQVPEQYTADIIRKLAAAGIPHDRLINVNFPAVPLTDVKGMTLCPQGRRKLDDNLDRRIDPQGRPYIWIGGQRTVPFREHPESDIAHIAQGYITITPISLDMTDYALMASLNESLSQPA